MMKFLVVSDEFTTRLILQKILSGYGEVHVALNGRKAAEAVKASLDDNRPYRLITLDVVMSELNGHDVLKSIRNLEDHFGALNDQRARIIITTSYDSCHSTIAEFNELRDGCLMKPIDPKKLLMHLEPLLCST